MFIVNSDWRPLVVHVIPRTLRSLDAHLLDFRPRTELLIALAIQARMLWAKLETVHEFKSICLFHVIGFVLEVFKTSAGIRCHLCSSDFSSGWRRTSARSSACGDIRSKSGLGRSSIWGNGSRGHCCWS